MILIIKGFVIVHKAEIVGLRKVMVEELDFFPVDHYSASSQYKRHDQPLAVVGVWHKWELSELLQRSTTSFAAKEPPSSTQ